MNEIGGGDDGDGVGFVDFVVVVVGDRVVDFDSVEIIRMGSDCLVIHLIRCGMSSAQFRVPTLHSSVATCGGNDIIKQDDRFHFDRFRGYNSDDAIQAKCRFNEANTP